MCRKLLIIFFSLSLLLYSQEKIVNDNTYLNQRKASVEVLNSSDDLVVVWKSEINNSKSNIYLTLLDSNLIPLNRKIRVNSSVGYDNDDPNIATNGKGLSVVVWSNLDEPNSETGYNVMARLFQDSIAITDEVLVNTFLPNSQAKSQVCMASNGDFIVVWESWFQDGSDRGIYAQQFNSIGTRIGDEFLVNTITEFGQCRPVVKYLDDKQFIIAWETWDEIEQGYDLAAKIFNIDGSAFKDEFFLNSYKTNNQWYVDISSKPDAGFNAVWCSWEQDGYDGGIYYREFDEKYEPVELEILVNSSVEFYQWLPKIKTFQNENKIIVWSSWNIDGSREGVYYKILDKRNQPITLEKRININTESYQWEPDIAILNSNNMISTWSGWGEISTDYEVFINKIVPNYLLGYIEENENSHPTGNSTSKIFVHVIDSTKLNGHEYEIKFDEFEESQLSYSILDVTSNTVIIDKIPFIYENGVQYLTDQFDGIIVELNPKFELNIDFEESIIINNSLSNTKFVIENSIIEPTIAPIDIALVWGSSDTLANGNLSIPLDTALSLNNIKEIPIPFYAKNIMTDEKIEILILEEDNLNKKWEVGDKIIFLTPKDFQSSDFSTHAQISSSFESSEIKLPTLGDSIIIYTNKPLTTNDTYRFSTSKSNIVLDVGNENLVESFNLSQNYPNPFNPSTQINYTIPKNSLVKINVYNVTGEKVTNLVNKVQSMGNHSITFTGAKLSSGVYFYTLEIEKVKIVKKMLFLK